MPNSPGILLSPMKTASPHTAFLFQERRMVRWTGTLTHWTCPSELRLQKVSGKRQSQEWP